MELNYYINIQLKNNETISCHFGKGNKVDLLDICNKLEVVLYDVVNSYYDKEFIQFSTPDDPHIFISDENNRIHTSTVRGFIEHLNSIRDMIETGDYDEYYSETDQLILSIVDIIKRVQLYNVKIVDDNNNDYDVRKYLDSCWCDGKFGLICM